MGKQPDQIPLGSIIMSVGDWILSDFKLRTLRDFERVADNVLFESLSLILKAINLDKSDVGHHFFPEMFLKSFENQLT